MALTPQNLGKLQSVSKTEPCRHCGKPDWCYRLDYYDVCKRDADPANGWERTSQTDKEGSYLYAPEEPRKQPRKAETKHWIYTNKDGTPLVRVTKTVDSNGKKTFRQARWEGNRWVTGLGSVDTKDIPIYRYQEIQIAISERKTIFIVEGESAADYLWSLGLVATTNIGGSLKWHPRLTDDLGDAKLILCPDRDKKGMRHMEQIAAEFKGEVSWLFCFPQFNWNRLPDSGGVDVEDWGKDFQLTRHDILQAVCDQPLKAPEKEDKIADVGEILKRLAEQELPETKLIPQLQSLSEATKISVRDLRNWLKAHENESNNQKFLEESKDGLESLLSHQIKAQTFNWKSVLPNSLGDAIITKADSLRLDPVFLLQPLWSACGAVLGGKLGIVGKEDGSSERDHWTEYPILWTCTIAPPSSGKSVSDRVILDPLRDLMDEQLNAYEEAEIELEDLEEKWNVKSKEEKEALRNSHENPKNFKRDMGKPRRSLLDEGEIEVIKRRIAEQPEASGSLWSADELIGLFKGLDQYKQGGKGNGRQFLLRAWSNRLWGITDRSNDKESFRFNKQIICLCGGMQPKLAAQFFDPDDDSSDPDGMQSRVLPAIPLEREDFYKWQESQCGVYDFLRWLYSSLQKDIPGGLVTMGSSTKGVWIKTWEEFRKRLRRYQESNPALAFFYGKMCSNVLRIALILHCWEHLFDPKDNFHELQSSTFEKAVKIAEYYIYQFQQAQVLFHRKPDNSPEFLAQIFNLCKEKGELSPRDVSNKFRRWELKNQPLRAANVKEMFATLAIANSELLQFDGRKLKFTPPLEKRSQISGETMTVPRNGLIANAIANDRKISEPTNRTTTSNRSKPPEPDLILRSQTRSQNSEPFKFKIGDWVIHPTVGVGQIGEIDEEFHLPYRVDTPSSACWVSAFELEFAPASHSPEKSAIAKSEICDRIEETEKIAESTLQQVFDEVDKKSAIVCDRICDQAKSPQEKDGTEICDRFSPPPLSSQSDLAPPVPPTEEKNTPAPKAKVGLRIKYKSGKHYGRLAAKVKIDGLTKWMIEWEPIPKSIIRFIGEVPKGLISENEFEIVE